MAPVQHRQQLEELPNPPVLLHSSQPTFLRPAATFHIPTPHVAVCLARRPATSLLSLTSPSGPRRWVARLEAGSRRCASPLVSPLTRAASSQLSHRRRGCDDASALPSLHCSLCPCRLATAPLCPCPRPATNAAAAAAAAPPTPADERRGGGGGGSDRLHGTVGAVPLGPAAAGGDAPRAAGAQLGHPRSDASGVGMGVAVGQRARSRVGCGGWGGCGRHAVGDARAGRRLGGGCGVGC